MGKLKSYLYDQGLLDDGDDYPEPDFDVVVDRDNTKQHQQLTSNSISSEGLNKGTDEEEMPF